MSPGARPRHVPMRRCVACRESFPKAELLRFVRDPQGRWQRDVPARAPGRGAWLCRPCATTADQKRLARFFKGQTPHVAAQLNAREGADTDEHQVGGSHG